MLVMKLIVGKVVAAGTNQTTLVLCISMHTRPFYWHWNPASPLAVSDQTRHILPTFLAMDDDLWTVRADGR